MSQQLVNNHLNDLDRYEKISGSLAEGAQWPFKAESVDLA